MKPFFIYTALAWLSLSANAQTDSSSILPEGTLVSVQLLQELSSKTSNSGDLVPFSTNEPVVVNNK